MTDVGAGEVGTAPPLLPETDSMTTHVDEDLIDYDSDDVSVAILFPKTDTKTNEDESGNEHRGPGISSDSLATNVPDPELEAIRPADPKDGSQSTHDSVNGHDEDEIASAENSGTVPAEDQGSVHEIDYDHDEIDYDTHNYDHPVSPVASQPHDTQSTHLSLPRPTSAPCPR